MNDNKEQIAQITDKEIAQAVPNINNGDNDIKNIADNKNSENDEVTFFDLGLNSELLKTVSEKGFLTPTPIQRLAIPLLLNNDTNIIAKARTGTGKTASFVLPILQKLMKNKVPGNLNAVFALILEPTRELALQTQKEFSALTPGNFDIRTCVLYGGAPYPQQIRDLKSHPQIIVGTPGRIKDHISRGLLKLDNIEYFILDEADEMLDLGFYDDITEIFGVCNKSARILLFSATMSDEIKKIAENFMGEYKIIEEKKVVDEPLLITQKFWIMQRSEKLSALVRLIDYNSDFYGLVFVQTKNDADEICKALDNMGFSVAVLHGDIMQTQREKVLERFRTKKTRVLVATDVAARGLDITGLTHVVNYSLPFDCETYVHRIGRTGRAGAAGVAITFVTMGETRKLEYLQKDVRRISRGSITEETIPSIDEIIAKKSSDLEGTLLKKLGGKPSKQFKRMADFLWRITDDDNDRRDILARLLCVMYEGVFSRDKYGEIKQRSSNGLLNNKGYTNRRGRNQHSRYNQVNYNSSPTKHFAGHHNNDHLESNPFKNRHTRQRGEDDRFLDANHNNDKQNWQKRPRHIEIQGYSPAEQQLKRRYDKDTRNKDNKAFSQEKHTRPQKKSNKGVANNSKNKFDRLKPF